MWYSYPPSDHERIVLGGPADKNSKQLRLVKRVGQGTSLPLPILLDWQSISNNMATMC